MQQRWYVGIQRGQWLALTAALLGWAFDGFEQGVFPLVGRPALTELLKPQVSADKLGETVQVWFNLMNVAYLLGAAAGGLGFGWLGDRIGRVRAMVFSVLTYALFTGACGLATEAWHLGVLRFIAAMGMGGEWSLGVALVMESWPERTRPVLAGLIGAAANVGFLGVSLMALTIEPKAIWNVPQTIAFLPGTFAGVEGPQIGAWRILLVLCVLPALLTFLLRIFVPESKKWEHVAANSPRVKVADIFVPGLRSRSLMGLCLGAVALLATWGAVQAIPAMVDGMKSVPHNAATYAQICSAVGAICGTFVVAVVAHRFSRRATYFFLCLVSLLLCEALFIPGQLKYWEFDPIFLFLVFLVGGFSATFYGWLPLYLPELFPTRVRATGQGFSFNFGRILAALGLLFVTFGIGDRLKGNYAFASAIIVLVYLVGLVLARFLPETKGQPLPE